MPGGDNTGPAGMGPMTGRAAGFCAGYPGPGSMNPNFGGGLGGRRRGGRGGRRNRFYATGLSGWQRAAGQQPAVGAGGSVDGGPDTVPSTAAATNEEQEVAALKQRAEELVNALDDIQKRVAKLESQPNA